LVSSVTTGSTAGHGSASKIIITVQSFVILSLSFWIVEEYLNNMYLREYVNGVFQAEGLIMGMIGTLLVLGSISSLIFMWRRHGEKKFGAISLDVAPSAPKVKTSAEVMTKHAYESAKPNMDFHQVVAALKADMADRRLSFGSIPGSGSEKPTTVTAPSGEVAKTSVLDQLTPNRQAPMTGPRPMQTGTIFPQRPLHDLRPQTPTGPRVEQVGPLAQQPIPALRPQEPSGSIVLQSSQAPAPQIPTNVTTVITGIMPGQKKKDPAATPDEKPASQ